MAEASLSPNTLFRVLNPPPGNPGYPHEANMGRGHHPWGPLAAAILQSHGREFAAAEPLTPGLSAARIVKARGQDGEGRRAGRFFPGNKNHEDPGVDQDIRAKGGGKGPRGLRRLV